MTIFLPLMMLMPFTGVLMRWPLRVYIVSFPFCMVATVLMPVLSSDFFTSSTLAIFSVAVSACQSRKKPTRVMLAPGRALK